MNLQEIRARYESRIAAIEHEMFELLGKLNKVNEVLTIAAQLSDGSPIAQGNIEETSAPVTDVTPQRTVESQLAANEDEAVAEAPVVETPQEVAASPEPEQQADEVVAEAPEPVAEEVEVVAEAPEPVAEEVEVVAEAPAVETPEEVAASTVTEQDIEEAVAAEADEVVEAEEAVAEVEEDVSAATEEPATAEAAAPASEAETASADDDVDALDKTDQFEQLFDTAMNKVQAQAEEAASSEDDTSSTDQFEQLFESAESEDDLDEASDDALASLREKLASAANEEQPKSPFMSLGKFLNRAK